MTSSEAIRAMRSDDATLSVQALRALRRGDTEGADLALDQMSEEGLDILIAFMESEIEKGAPHEN